MNKDQSAIPAFNPFALFDEWFAEAQTSEPNDPNAMALATSTPGGAPSVRMVLLKGHGPELSGGAGGFRFYTNSQSRKGEEIRANMQASLLFHWKSLRRQIRIEGPLAEVTAEEADAYFHSRGLASQIASAASDQSRPLPERGTYLERIAALDAEYAGQTKIPRPPHWTGFTLTPNAIEFWQDRDARAHDRRRFTRAAPDAGPDAGPNADWESNLLYP